MSTTILLMGADEAPLLRHSLPAALAQEGAHVVVLDNASSDGTDALAAEHDVEYLRLPERLPYAHAMNEGLRQTGGDAVLLLNADCFLTPGFLAAARPRLEEDRVGSVAPKLVRAEPAKEGSVPFFALDAIDAAGMVVDRRRKNTLVGHGRPSLAYDTPGEAFGVDGAAALYRRETLEDCAVDAEIFDEDMEMWASDVDLAWRARLLGWRCVYEPDALAYHIRYYSPSTRAQVPVGDRRLQFRNRYLMMIKNDTAGALLRDAPRLLAYEVLALGFALLRERSLLRGYADALRLLGGARRRRRAIQQRRRVKRVPLGLEPTP